MFYASNVAVLDPNRPASIVTKSTLNRQECRKHFTAIAPAFVRKQFICLKEGRVAGGVYMWETQRTSEKFYNGPWMEGICERYGSEPKITYFETFALADKASEKAGALG
jgi:hypothetical protein